MPEARKIDLDRLARAAMHEGALSAGEDDAALMRALDGKVAGWNIALKPIAPRTVSDGGIALPIYTVDVQKYQITVGKVVGIGPTALDGKTSSGVELRKVAKDIETAEQLLGKFVMHQRFTGQEIKRRISGQIILLVEVTNLLMIVDNPDEWVFHV
jgi:hypothetical protein